MKTYIGTKQVKAEPMTYGEYLAKAEKPAHYPHCLDDEGYLVEYEDGYQGWSPKDTFEEHYRIAEDWQDRLHIEIIELEDRYFQLNAFLDKYASDSPKPFQKWFTYLRLQFIAMGQYLNLLNRRSNVNNTTYPDPVFQFDFGTAINLLCMGYCVRRAGWNGKGMFVIKQVPATISADIIPNMTSLPQRAKDLILAKNGLICYESQMLIYHSQDGGRADSWVPSSSDIFATDWEIAD